MRTRSFEESQGLLSDDIDVSHDADGRNADFIPGRAYSFLAHSEGVQTIEDQNSPYYCEYSSHMQRVKDHCHAGWDRPQDKKALCQLVTASILTAIFMCGEFTGGMLANSLTIMTDAAHMLSDLASFIISLAALQIGRRHASKRFSFGFYRAEVLGALVSILIIWLLTGVLVYLAVLRVIHQDFKIDPLPMLITAACGVAFNIILGIILSGMKGHHGHSHSIPGFGHSHGSHHTAHNSNKGRSDDNVENGGSSHDHDLINIDIVPSSTNQSFRSIPPPPPPPTSLPPRSVSVVPTPLIFRRDRARTISVTSYPTERLSHIDKTRNINVRAAFIHVIGDLVQSIGVLIASIIIKFKPEWKLADPICTFIFSVLVLITTLNVAKDIIHVLMEGTPADCDFDVVRTDLQNIEGVKQAHSLHLWSLTMDKGALAVHLAIDTLRHDALTIMDKATRMIKSKYNIMFVTVQVEPYDDAIMPLCLHCSGPK